MYILIHSIFLLINLIYISPLMIVLEANKEFCIKKKIKQNDTLKFSYAMSGIHQDSTIISIKGPTSEVLYENDSDRDDKKKKERDEFLYHVTQQGNYHVCFTASQDNTIASFPCARFKGGAPSGSIASTGIS